MLGRLLPRVRGAPTSTNGASSFHLWWQLDSTEPLKEAAAELEILVPPSVPQLYFWAMQVGFHDGQDSVGSGHTGLQWLPTHPPQPAVNWGGYRAADGAELSGSLSSLPSLDGNPNTRLFDWVPGRAYELRVRGVHSAPGPSGTQAWQASVCDLSTGRRSVIRDLHVPARYLSDPVVWSEVFARCDDPSVTVRWSRLRAVTATGRPVVPRGVAVTYQARSQGGCDNTTVTLDGEVGGILQTTNSERTVRHGSVLPWSQM